MAETDIAALADRCEKAQCDDIRSGNCIKAGNDCCLCASDNLRDLIRLELVATHGAAVFFTSLGLAVRAHLLEQAHD